MARTAHQAIGEFNLRPPIAGLLVLDGVTPVRDSFENPSPANARTVFAALRAVFETESPYNNVHKADYHRIRALLKTLEPISATSGREGGDSASDVAALARNALQQNAAITALFGISGSGANIILTRLSRVANDATLNIAYDNGNATGLTPDTSSVDTTAGVASVAQVETATAAGTITGSGNATVIVTAAGMTGSPKTISVAVLNGDTASDWAAKVRAALAADAAVTALFAVSGATTAIILTRLNPDGVGNDGTLNISLDNGTCTGITTAATSADTTAGVAGVAQVETQTIVGTPTTDGNINVVVTAAGLTGSPLTVQVPVQGSQFTDVLATDAVYAAAKASATPAEQALRAALVTIAQDYIPGFTGIGLTNAGRF